MNKFISSAKKVTTLSPLMTNRDKVDISEVISKFPSGVTITAFDFIPGKNGVFPILHIKELPDSFIFGGYVMSRVCEGWTDLYEGDIETASAELEKAGGVKVLFKSGRTKGGNQITLVDIVE